MKKIIAIFCITLMLFCVACSKQPANNETTPEPTVKPTSSIEASPEPNLVVEEGTAEYYKTYAESDDFGVAGHNVCMSNNDIQMYYGVNFIQYIAGKQTAQVYLTDEMVYVYTAVENDDGDIEEHWYQAERPEGESPINVSEDTAESMIEADTITNIEYLGTLDEMDKLKITVTFEGTDNEGNVDSISEDITAWVDVESHKIVWMESSQEEDGVVYTTRVSFFEDDPSYEVKNAEDVDYETITSTFSTVATAIIYPEA